ncbi:bifunctional ADP-dependent (S)-NAD(P)H-hydrate d ehydratase/NAD(P)H-hydrate epimerase [Desulfonema ishimotonii]|uniref:Bifunctional NAD(P)H-hydrate repair enzyme n=1 Tax=Desulfonema ishimotonii TaxID=45657 RepID=A0A401FSA1_9BACT|nr:NAD(P)H-hydrate dehydratase [Desulfonema ishimotonii]GBC59833.1 bifunctional ADP-dependent (S)-NAD(P)H-hydrate d ehydratase/NAD(P)H-hydrate epimerase [Desulfonema ishimotonii]
MKISSVNEMREMDRAAIEQYGIIEEILMENAGLAAFGVIAEQIGAEGKAFLIFCGGGNNGGDGLVVARKIHSDGGKAHIIMLGDPDGFRGAARTNFNIVSRLPVTITRISAADEVRGEFERCDAVVDAIFGTGLVRDVGGKYREIIEMINAARKPVISLDIPSGVHGDTGNVMGVSVRADHTITFGLPKIGNLLYPGYALGGTLHVTHISFPPSLYRSDALHMAVSVPPALPPRNPDGHKGSFGDVLFIAGAAGYYGAPCFAALSFMKAGGGYARLAAPASVTPFIAAKGSELVFIPQKETPSGSIALENRDVLTEISRDMDMVVIGPGISLDRESQELVREMARRADVPLLADGDGITALCGDHTEILRQRKAPTVLTPHMGEMARITGLSVAEISADKVGVLRRTAADLNAVIVLKGAHTLIGLPDQRVFLNMSGNSGMATAGSGDVLTGTIAAMFGLGLPLADAVRKGVFIHGLSGDLAAREKGEDGITARDITEFLPDAMKADREGIDSGLRARYTIDVIA